MTRVDLYGVVHKGLVAELFEVTALAARTDFSDTDAAARTLVRIRGLLSLLREQVDAQTTFLLPELDRISPVIASDIRSDHVRLRGLEQTIDALVARAEGAPEREMRSYGYRIHAQLRRLTAEHLLHMEREETTVNRALWAHRTDDELRAIRTEMISSLAEPCLEAWITLVLSAVSSADRSEIVRELGLENRGARS
ncbi:MAG: hypothetical protein KDA27_19495 [Candidatus Eisenbacteria bacterium]|uniref:Hemerythrin-like domain-containing protein n=1 Tax=Eiseniibacteriota bacterium TaxID=2212470 RepID=A0A956SEZ9_UNCEI|nr:hypothetical protein [Candidatus Eisenbacteria bacterium]MCB9465741.1 hypothetical protein [Candidatus Eisenbacteria bacterium]